MAKPVTCRYCKQKFDREKEEFENPSPRMFYHKECYQKFLREGEERKANQPIDYKEKVREKAKEWLGSDYSPQRINFQIKNYIKDGWKPEEIYLTLCYWIDIKKSSSDKANGGIGIIGYVKSEALKYYKKQESITKEANSIENVEDYISFRDKEREVPSKRYRIQRPKRTSFFDLD